MENLQQDAGNEPQAAVQEEVNWKRFAWDIFETLALAVILFVGINAVSARVRVDGFSMEPTLDDGEFILVSKLSYRFGEVDRGDIIVFHYPVNPDEELIKRVIGLPGDQIRVEDGRLFINGAPMSEPYIAAAPVYSGEWIVPDDSLFVLGDNRNDSSDSHSWGLLPLENVVGKAVLIYWPPGNWETIEHTDVQVAQ